MHPSIKKYFSGRKLLFATMHGKEQILRELLEQQLGVEVITPENFNTDDFGTFSGEEERKFDAATTAEHKCDAAFRLTGESLVLASEGSFGGHPATGLVAADEEWLVLKDYKYHRLIKVKVVSSQTNFSGNQYYEAHDAAFFAAQSGFPSHALIIRKDKDDISELHKGIRTNERLKESIKYFLKNFGKLYIETDMRAHLNPTRQKVIRQAGEKLIKVLHEFCPVCEAPAFQVKQVLRGTPSEESVEKARATREVLCLCEHCGHTERREITGQRQHASDFWNELPQTRRASFN